MTKTKLINSYKKYILPLMVLDYLWLVLRSADFENAGFVEYAGYALFTAAMVLMLISGFWKKNRRILFVLCLPVLFVVLEFIKIPMGGFSGYELGSGAFYYFNAAVIAFCAPFVFDDVNERKSFIKNYLLAITLITLVLLSLVLIGTLTKNTISFFHGTFTFGVSYSSSGRLIITMSGMHQYYIGYLALFFFFISIWLFEQYRSKKAFAGLIYSLMVFGIVTVLSGSRNAWLGMFVGCLILVFILLQKTKLSNGRIVAVMAGLTAAGCGCSVLIINFVYKNVLHSIRDIFYGMSTFTSRTTIWKGVFELLQDKPVTFLTGLPKSMLSTMNEYIDLADDITHMHSGNVQTICLMGISGLVFIIVITFLWASGFFRIIISRDKTVGFSLKVLMIPTMVLFIENLFEPVLFSARQDYNFLNFLFYLLIGLMFCIIREKGEALYRCSRLKKHLVRTLAVIVCLMPLFLLIFAYFAAPEAGEDDASDSAAAYVETYQSTVKTAPGVTEEMLQTDYWLDDLNGDEIILTSDEIEALNDENANNITSSTGMSISLFSITEEFDGDFVKDLVNTYSVPENPEKYFVKGEATTEEYWQDLVDNMNVDAIGGTVNIRFGYSVTRSTLRQLPSRDFVGSGKDKLVDKMIRSDFLPFEPLAVAHESADGLWYYVIMNGYAGWIEKKYVALCNDREAWLEREEERNSSFLIVTANELRLADDPYSSTLSGLVLPMGCRMTLADNDEIPENLHKRKSYGCYVVKVPSRDKDGMITDTYIFIPVNSDVHQGYLDYTGNNLLTQAFKCLGDRYGWAGDHNAFDCSGYTRAVYACMGINLPRGAEAQVNLSGTDTGSLEGMDHDKRLKVINSLPAGTLLYFKGHIMIYIGTVDDEPYVISSVSSICLKNEGEFEVTDPISVNSVAINSLTETYRKTGYSWIDSLENYCKV